MSRASQPYYTELLRAEASSTMSTPLAPRMILLNDATDLIEEVVSSKSKILDSRIQILAKAIRMQSGFSPTS
ncbi:hypothetical protein L204_106248 [Cryptococcus depauperatus]